MMFRYWTKTPLHKVFHNERINCNSPTAFMFFCLKPKQFLRQLSQFLPSPLLNLQFPSLLHGRLSFFQWTACQFYSIMGDFDGQKFPPSAHFQSTSYRVTAIAHKKLQSHCRATISESIYTRQLLCLT